MQMILPNSGAQESGCLKAVAPIIAQGKAMFEGPDLGGGDGDGATLFAISTIAAAADAPYGGTMHNKGCKRVLVEVDYIEGDDCDACTSPDTLTIVTASFCMEADSTYEVPAGFWSEIRVATADAACAAEALLGTQKQSVFLHSGYKPACVTCKVQVPA